MTEMPDLPGSYGAIPVDAGLNYMCYRAMVAGCALSDTDGEPRSFCLQARQNRSTLDVFFCRPERMLSAASESEFDRNPVSAEP
jgi:hypothetical protein